MKILTFQEYVQYRNDNLTEFDIKNRFMQGYKQQYDKQMQRPDSDPLETATYEKYKSKVLPALQKIKGNVNHYAQKSGIPVTLAATLLLAGATGGLGAVPVAALTYFVRKQIVDVAGKTYDTLADFAGAKKSPVDVAWTTYDENILSGAADWAAEKVGQATGFVTGKLARYGSNIGKMLKDSFQQLSAFAKENRLELGKVIFLMAVGAAIGYGIGSIVDQTKTALFGINQSNFDKYMSNLDKLIDKSQEVIKNVDAKINVDRMLDNM